MPSLRRTGWCVAAMLAAGWEAQALPPNTTNVVINGSFESSSSTLTNWNFGPSLSAPGNCSYNAAAAPGTETVTSVAGFAATDGSNIALGSAHSTTALGEFSCDLYQDVAIPAHATTAVLSLDVAIVYDGVPRYAAAIFWGLYPTSSIPNYFDTPLVSTLQYYEPNVSSTALVHQTVSLNVSSLAGTTVRLAIINGTDSSVGTASVVGIDNVTLDVTTSTPPVTTYPTPAIGVWGAIALGGLLFLFGARRLRTLA